MRRYAVAVVSTLLAVGPLMLAVLAVGTLWPGMYPASAAPAYERPPTTPPWSITPTPALSGTAGLSGVSCTSSTTCMAVGGSSAGVGRTLTESWNGGDWSVIPSLDENDGNDGLAAVSCTNSSKCMAVGAYTDDSGFDQTLAESWNSTVWSIVPSPDDSTSDNVLNAVSCVGTMSCVAVGYYIDVTTETTQTLVESWNGATWSIVASPAQSGDDASLWGVRCSSSTVCTAVGNYAGGSEIGQTLIESWNGVSWSIDPSPNRGTDENNELNAVACPSSTSCIAVGDSFNTSDIDQSLVESWNGSRWSLVPSPSEQASDNALESVACVSTTYCMAIGYYFNGAFAQQSLVESWNGVAWALVLSPDEEDASTQLSAVAGAGPKSWQAVGSYSNSDSTQTLVETAVPILSTTSVVSVTSKPVAGQPITMGVRVAAPKGDGGTPTGSVTVSDGPQHCTAVLSGSHGTAAGVCSITEHAVGDYSFIASYAGDKGFASSTTAKATFIRVTKATSTTTLLLSVTKVTRGDEEAEHLSVKVAPRFAGERSTGTVSVKASTTKLCVIKLSSAEGSCRLTRNQLAVGTYRLVATYRGSADVQGSASSTERLAVAK